MQVRILGPFQVEETGLFPPLQADFPEQIAALQADHIAFHAVLGEAAVGTPTDPNWPDRLTSTLRALRQHILREQDGVFPAALANLKTADWDQIDEVRARVGSGLHLADVSS